MCFNTIWNCLNDIINNRICYMTNSEKNSRYQSDNIFSIYCKENECDTKWCTVNSKIINGLVIPT